MNHVCFYDVETTGLDPATDRVIEIGAVLWSVPHRAIVECVSLLIRGESNAAEAVNGIPAGVLSEGRSEAVVWTTVRTMFERADAVLAHGAAFDRSFTPPDIAKLKPWACTMNGFAWPKAASSRSLAALALAHGVGVVDAHRALADCLTLARVLERVGELGVDLDAMLRRALRPKVRVVSLAPFERKDEVRAAGFGWSATDRVWSREMPREDAEALAFPWRTE